MTTALVTGATRGLGRALAFDLARSGTTVLGTAIHADGLADLARDSGDLPIIPIRSDITDPQANAALVKRIGPAGLDLLIHSAGILGPRVGLEQYPLATFERVLAVNTTGPFDLTAKLARSLNPGATVIFISSGVGVVGRANWGAYCVSKWGVEGLARIWAEELRDRDIKVFLVDPGAMRTEMRAAAYPQEDPMTLIEPKDNLAVFRWLVAHAPLTETGGRWKAKGFAAP
jgi:NAD(P)-dependent dehydrogenase (short-subunit alcohol dehydrogenase family)